MKPEECPACEECEDVLADVTKERDQLRADNEALRGRLERLEKIASAAKHVPCITRSFGRTRIGAQDCGACGTCMARALASPPATEPRGEAVKDGNEVGCPHPCDGCLARWEADDHGPIHAEPQDIDGLARVLATGKRVESVDHLLDVPAPASAKGTTAKLKSPYHKHIAVTAEDAERGYVMVDIYQLLYLFEVTDPCFAHAIKKLFCPGQRSGGKSVERDIADVVWTLKRWQEIRERPTVAEPPQPAPVERGGHLADDPPGVETTVHEPIPPVENFEQALAKATDALKVIGTGYFSQQPAPVVIPQQLDAQGEAVGRHVCKKCRDTGIDRQGRDCRYCTPKCLRVHCNHDYRAHQEGGRCAGGIAGSCSCVEFLGQPRSAAVHGNE